MTNLLGVLQAAVLLILPGCWILSIPSLSRFDFTKRISLGFVLSPLVVYWQFLICRSVGLTFETTGTALLGVNLIPIVFLLRKTQQSENSVAEPSPGTVWPYVIVLTIAFLFLGLGAWPHDVRTIESGHSWLRADVTYSLAQGDFPPQERQVANLDHAYPWAFYVQQTYLGRALDWPLLANTFFFNHLWLLAVSVFAVALASLVIERSRSRAFALICLFFGVNIVGFILMRVWPDPLQNIHHSLWGDARYSPWIVKFRNATPMVPGLAICMALLYFLCERPEERRDRTSLIVIFFLLVATGTLYPLLLPVACVFVSARILALFAKRFVLKKVMPWSQPFILIGLVALGLVICFGHLAWQIQSREAEGMVQFSSKKDFLRKGIETVIVLSPLLLGTLFALKALWRKSPTLSLTLLLSAAGCMFMSSLFFIPGFSNEYKFMFGSGMALFVFPAIALNGKLTALGKKGSWVLAVVAIGCALPLTYEPFFFGYKKAPFAIDSSHFEVALTADHPESQLIQQIASDSPQDAIVVLDRWDMYWPTLTRRSMYISPEHNEYLQGTNIHTWVQVAIAGGYSLELVRVRRATVRRLFQGKANKKAEALDTMKALNRPLVIVLRKKNHPGLLKWLARTGQGKQLAESEARIAWLVD